MTKHTFLISDTHFGHKFSLKWDKPRPFQSVEEMDELMITNWNAVVKPTDRIYHMGDVVIRPKTHMSILSRLNGDKVLIKGNHDIYKLEYYTPYFRDIRASHVLDNCILSHIPVHTNQIARFKGNIHGHLHEDRVLDLDGNIDPNYYSVCVEKINYTPIEFSCAIKLMQAQKELIQ
jgi:calcineurin-like phosphoesterase family protein